MFRYILGCGFLLILMGCMTVGPDYQRPDIQTPVSFRFEEKEAQQLANTAWWEQLQDPVLNGLVKTALDQNKDLLIATARIEEFFGRYFTTRSDQYPFVGVDADVFRQRLSENLNTPIQDVENPHNQYEIFLNGVWEIDFWGKYRRATEAAKAELIGTEEARRAVALSLVSAVATAYVDILALDKQLQITRRTAESRKQTLDLFQLRFEKGNISEVDLSQARSEYEDALARIPDIERAIGQTENSLSILLGKNPGPIARGSAIDELVLLEVPAAVPSEVLQQRPDIRGAELTLIASNARIGVARALYFPTISLTGAFGSVSTELSDLFSSSSRSWDFGVPVSVPLFTAGSIGGEVKGAEAVKQQAVYSYQQTILNAFREVDDALLGTSKSRQRLAALGRQLEALRSYARLARLRYDEGYTSYLEVLDAERSLFNVELAYTSSQNEVFRSLIAIYKSMGGGWVTRVTEEISTQPVMKAGFVP